MCGCHNLFKFFLHLFLCGASDVSQHSQSFVIPSLLGQPSDDTNVNRSAQLITHSVSTHLGVSGRNNVPMIRITPSTPCRPRDTLHPTSTSWQPRFTRKLTCRYKLLGHSYCDAIGRLGWPYRNPGRPGRPGYRWPYRNPGIPTGTQGDQATCWPYRNPGYPIGTR